MERHLQIKFWTEDYHSEDEVYRQIRALKRSGVFKTLFKSLRDEPVVIRNNYSRKYIEFIMPETVFDKFKEEMTKQGFDNWKMYVCKVVRDHLKEVSNE